VLTDLFEWLAASPLALALGRHPTLYIVLNATHILGVGLLVGAILPLDLRLMGFFRAVPVAVIAPFLSRIATSGLLLAIATGLCLFSVRPAEYAANPAFLTKLALLVLGSLNALALHRTSGWRDVLEGESVSRWVTLSAALSAIIWLAALLAGRWIGFV
jgi:hypothetical protein